MDSIAYIIHNTVPVSSFNRGDAGRIFDAVKSGGPKLVLKHNEPECVLISPEEYRALQQELEDLRDYKLAVERLAHAQEQPAVPWEDTMRDFGVSQEQLNSMEDVELA